jgi:hypothetical protein
MFSLFSPNTAGNYAASFRQAVPVEGFGDVREDRFADLLSKLPLEKYKQEMALAQSALQEVGSQKRDQMQYDYYRERDAAEAKRGRMAKLLELVGSGGVGVASLAMPKKRDAYDTLLSAAQTEEALGATRGTRMAGSNAGVAAALKGLGGAPLMEATTAAPDVAGLSNAIPTYSAPKPSSLDDVTKTLSSMELFEKLLKGQAG